jgi:hypothetical protein
MEKELTLQRLYELLEYDESTGVFTWKKPCNKYSRVAPGDKAGGVTEKGYIRIRVDGIKIMAHRLAWFYVYGEWPKRSIDHRNGVRADNRLSNLRDVEHWQNLRNRVGRGTSKVNRGGKWMAKITVERGVKKYLGVFDTEEEAHQAYLEAKKQYHPECMRKFG